MKVGEILKGCSTWMPDGNRDDATVSIILTTAGEALPGMFARAVESVIAQSFRGWQLVIVDDCSTDGSFEQIQDFMARDKRISCVRHAFKVDNPAISIFEAYEHCRGEYIAFLADDCEWLPAALEEMLGFVQGTGIEAAYGEMVFVNYGESSGAITPVELGNINICTADSLEYRNYIANSSLLLHRQVLETVGLYDPNELLQGLADWDLISRIAYSYVLTATGCFMGYQRGIGRYDSSGANGFNEWDIAAHRAANRNELLLPANFANYETSAHPAQQGKHLVTIMSAAVDASTILCFHRMRAYPGYAQRPVHLSSGLNAATLDSDCIIIPRDLHLIPDDMLADCAQAGIPVYYYVDDKFIELESRLSELPANEATYIKTVASLSTPEILAQFHGVIVTSQALRDWFAANKMHNNIILHEPIAIEPLAVQAQQQDSAELRVAFLGGRFRGGALRDKALPALEHLAMQMPVKLFCPDDMDIATAPGSGISICKYARTWNLEAALRQLTRFAPQILVHPGNPALSNNRYKTQNALLNAVALDAALVTVDCEPFLQGASNGCYTAVADTAAAWQAGIESLADDNRRKAQIAAARQYCLQRYALQRYSRELFEELGTLPDRDDGTSCQRLQTLMDCEIKRNLDKRHNRPTAAAESAALGKAKDFAASMGKVYVPISVPINSGWLSQPGPIEHKRSYTLTPSFATISELNVVFASAVNGDYQGSCTVEVSIAGELQRTAIIDLGDITAHAWTPICFEPLENPEGLPLEIEFSMEYTGNSPKLFLYEDKRRKYNSRIVATRGRSRHQGKHALYCYTRPWLDSTVFQYE
jgi:hypothetical protein